MTKATFIFESHSSENILNNNDALFRKGQLRRLPWPTPPSILGSPYGKGYKAYLIKNFMTHVSRKENTKKLCFEKVTLVYVIFTLKDN